ncbi:MAG: serine hydrolase domain-containing protein [Acidimicrobiia bacterium]
MDFAALDSYLDNRAARDIFSGVALITRDGNELFSGAYGFASRAWKVPTTVDTRFDTASVTKLFTAVVSLQLVEEGLISLDTPVVEYLGLEGTSVDPRANLGHLLTHTSGIGDDADEEAGEVYADIWRERTSYLVRETEDLLPQFIGRKPNFPPGQGCRYCNAGYVLTGLMVEKATGRSYRDRVAEHVFEPAGMTGSGFFAMDIVEPDVAEGADPVDGRWVRNVYSYPPIGSPDGGAHCTAVDLDRFLTTLRGGGLLGEEWTERFFRPVVEHSDNSEGTLHFGYGLEFQHDHDGGLSYFEKEGVNAGTSAVLRHYPDRGVTVTLLSNMERGVWEPRRFIHSMIMSTS